MYDQRSPQVNNISLDSSMASRAHLDGYDEHEEEEKRSFRHNTSQPSMLHISSSRIQESYFDDEMQAKVSRSARRR